MVKPIINTQWKINIIFIQWQITIIHKRINVSTKGFLGWLLPLRGPIKVETGSKNSSFVKQYLSSTELVDYAFCTWFESWLFYLQRHKSDQTIRRCWRVNLKQVTKVSILKKERLWKLDQFASAVFVSIVGEINNWNWDDRWSMVSKALYQSSIQGVGRLTINIEGIDSPDCLVYK